MTAAVSVPPMEGRREVRRPWGWGVLRAAVSLELHDHLWSEQAD